MWLMFNIILDKTKSKNVADLLCLKFSITIFIFYVDHSFEIDILLNSFKLWTLNKCLFLKIILLKATK